LGPRNGWGAFGRAPQTGTQAEPGVEQRKTNSPESVAVCSVKKKTEGGRAGLEDRKKQGRGKKKKIGQRRVVVPGV